MDFGLTSEQRRLQSKCRELAQDFAGRAAAHDRDASHPVENYRRLIEEGFLALSVGRERGGDRKSTRLNSSHTQKSRMPSSA